MKRFLRPFGALAFAFLILVNIAAAAELQVGNRMESFKLPDQHEKEGVVDGKVRLLLFTRDREAHTIVSTTLEGVAEDFLTKRSAVYVADISGMPGIIASMFAMPKMRKYPYRVLLEQEVNITRDFPSKSGAVTIVRLNDLKIEAILNVSSMEGLKKILFPQN